MFARAGLVHVGVKGGFNPAGLAVSFAATARNPPRGIRREGAGWLWWLGCATLLAPIDLLSGAPGIMNFTAAKRG